MMDKQMIIRKYRLHDVFDYINWIYFFHAWQFPPRFASIANVHGCDVCKASWLNTFQKEEIDKATQAMQLFKEAGRMMQLLDRDYMLTAKVRLCSANSDGDDLLLDGMRLPLLRQQIQKDVDMPFLCLSDFVRPLSSPVEDTVGVFCATVDSEMEQLFEHDDYKRMLVQTLCDRFAEAATEKLHEEVRKTIWGYAPDENLSIADMLVEKFQGIRPAIGYPSLPDLSLNFLLDKLLDYKSVGIVLTENGMMHPHASVSGLMISHPQSRYFAVGRIGNDQLNSYAKRRGIEVGEMKKFLVANLL
jgi:cobalamin-dependent methionine synthase I